MCSPFKSGIYQGQWRMSTATGQFFGEVIWVIISVAEGGLLGLTQQMDSFHSLGSPIQGGHHFLSPSAAAFQTPSSPATNPFASHQQQPRSLLLSSLTAPVNGSGDGRHSDSAFPGHNSPNNNHNQAPSGPLEDHRHSPSLVIHNINLDRLKSTPTDDNQENCFKVCSNILTKSPGSGERSRRSSFNTSYQATVANGGSSRSLMADFATMNGSSNQSLISGGGHQPVIAGHQHEAGGELNHAMQVALHNQGAPAQLHQHPQVAGAMHNQSTSNTHFPPTPPPSEDMVL